MTVLVDTSVWSQALRMGGGVGEREVLARLIRDFQVVVIGPIRQEALSGMRHQAQFEKARLKLRAFPDLLLTTEVFERAAEYFNTCRSHGLQGSHIDFTICAAAVHYDLELYTLDQDFFAFAEIIPLRLYNSAAL